MCAHVSNLDDFYSVFIYQVSLQSGDGPDITLTEVEKPPTEIKERWKVTEKMNMIPQYAFAGDYTGGYFSVFQFHIIPKPWS